MKKFSVSPVGAMVWVWLLIVFGLEYAINYAVVITLHELGHYLTAKHLGYKLSRFSLSPYGVSLSYHGQCLERTDELWIALAGPIVNLVSALLALGFVWLFPTTYFLFDSFSKISLVIAIANLLPAYPLDGGRVFLCLSKELFDGKKAEILTKVFNIILSVSFSVMFCVSFFVNFNPTLLLFAIFLFGGFLDFDRESKYEKINVFCKKTKNYVKPKMLCVDGNVSLKEMLSKVSVSKTVLFCVVFENGKTMIISEKLLLKLAQYFPLNLTINEVYSKSKIRT
ncbi:MAG: hypothetical protein IJ817_00505 [Clostridia bacterium]|nr:hypothetical protein [Clostridia bacterium]